MFHCFISRLRALFAHFARLAAFSTCSLFPPALYGTTVFAMGNETSNGQNLGAQSQSQATIELRADPDARIEEKLFEFPYPHKKLTVTDVTQITQFQRQWIPRSDGGFPWMIANPREPTFSLAFRTRDKAFRDKVVAVSLGDTFPLYRWEGLGRQQLGVLQLAIEGGIWAVFDYPNNDPDLLNSDYMVGIPVSYSEGPWHYRARLYHISSHLGDEYMVRARDLGLNVVRLNPSFEAIDFLGMYDMGEHIRLYGGLGYVVRSDETFHLRHFYGDLGIELRAMRAFFHGRNLVAQPYFASNLHLAQTHRYRPEINTNLGIEWSQIPGAGRKFRTCFEYYEGYSLEGQFGNSRTNYFAIKVSYGY